MYISNGSTDPWGEVPAPKCCIVVDDLQAAINNQYPCSQWTLPSKKAYADESENCTFALDVSSYLSNNKIRIYPNPVNDILHFDINVNIEKAMLFDISGRKILEQNNINNISVSDLQKESYLLKLFSDKGIQTEKIIVK